MAYQQPTVTAKILVAIFKSEFVTIFIRPIKTFIHNGLSTTTQTIEGVAQMSTLLNNNYLVKVCTNLGGVKNAICYLYSITIFAITNKLMIQCI